MEGFGRGGKGNWGVFGGVVVVKICSRPKTFCPRVACQKIDDHHVL